MSDVKTTTRSAHSQAPRNGRLAEERVVRLPRRFAAPQWFGDAGVAPGRVRAPLWQQAEPVAWRFLAGLRSRLVWTSALHWH